MRWLGLALALAACHSPHASKRRKPLDTAIRAIDFANRPYLVDGLGKIPVHHGRGVVGFDGALVLEPPVYVDFDRDRVEDAVVIAALNRVGHPGKKIIDIYTMRAGSLTRFATHETDLADKVRVDGRVFVIESNFSGKSFVYAWEEGELRQQFDEDDEEID